MRRFFKKSLALMMVATMLLPSSVTAKEIAPTVGNKQTETPPTVTTQSNIPTDVPVTTEEEQDISTTEVKTTEASTEKDKSANEAEVVKTDAAEVVDKDIKETELNAFKEENESEKITQTLLIKADKESDIPKDGKVLSSYEDTYLVSFPDTETAKAIYEDVKTDASLNIPFGIATGNKTSSSTVEPDVLDNLEEVIKEDDKKDSSFKITEDDYSIALIDTGVPKSEKNVEFVSMLDDDGYDEHGHGTSMLESIRKQDKDAKILSIKALDKNGYGDAATIYAAIKYAVERKVDMINLSISGFATEGNKCIEDAIKEAVKQGIIVVGAAGNDNLPASAFIPGGIDEIIVVGACNENNERKAFSNYGITVDYYANASSTSQASAIVTGTISANKGDIKKLDDVFFKTPDLSIFDEELKNRNISSVEEDGEDKVVDPNEWEDGSEENPETDESTLTDEEYVLGRLNTYVNQGGFHVAANVTIHKGANINPKTDMKNTYVNAGHTVYVVDKELIGDPTTMTVSGSGWSRQNLQISVDASDTIHVENGWWAAYDISASGDDKTVNADCTITIPKCVRCINDGSLHDWVIKITQAEFTLGKNRSVTTATNPTDVINSRDKLVAVHLRQGELPEFTTGIPAILNDQGAVMVPYKADAANKFDFEMYVGDAPAGSVLLTGFSDLDQWQLYPVGQRQKNADGSLKRDSNGNPIKLEEAKNGNANDQTTDNSFDERIDIKDANQLASKDVWLASDSKLSPTDEGSGVRVHSTQFVNLDNASISGTDSKASIWFGVKANSGEVTKLYWNGCRCQTDIGLSMKSTIEPVTAKTYVTYETTTEGVYGDPSGNTATPWTLLDGSTGTGYPGSIYQYTYTGAGVDTSIWDPSRVWAHPDTTAPYYSPYTITYTYTASDHDFHLYVPRKRCTYYFDPNKPANATSNVVNMPDSISKLIGNVCGNYNRTPSLKGWTFLGFFTDPTGGTAYNPNEVMTTDKTFYAHWEPMKYYVRYNGNGNTNFNENAQVGMLDGEYHQNTVTGSTAYQIFTYDSAGEALRANGFSRRGYDFVCWNTTPSRSGTDRNPGYVKPATENWVKGDGTDLTATLDGTHTYPVVDLYAIWRQKLGTETLTVVSEETGNPVANVNVKLTNTSNNNQVITGTTNAQGKVTVNNLHWFPYNWTSTSVPAGYKAMQDVAFDINPARTPDNEDFLTINDNRILYMKHVSLKINSKVSDIIDGENAPAFMYHITGQDVAGVTHSYDVMVQIDAESETGYNVVPVATNGEEPYMFAGNYTITQYDVSRYIAGNAENVTNTTPVGKNATANLTDNDFAEVLFPYTIKQYGGLSGVHSLINKLTK